MFGAEEPGAAFEGADAVLDQGGGELDVALAVEFLQVGPVAGGFGHAQRHVEGGGEAGDDDGDFRRGEFGADAVH